VATGRQRRRWLKDEKHRNLLDLSTGEWELLDEDGKADRLDLYYVEKKKKEKHAKKYRKLLDLSTGEWELLDEDDKEDLVDLYYAEKNRVAKAEKNRVATEKRADQTEGEKEEACRKRNTVQKAYRQRVNKDKAALVKAAAEAFETEVLTAVLEVPGITMKRKQRVAEKMSPAIPSSSHSYKKGKFHIAWNKYEHRTTIDNRQ
jgi:hypothetical protein